MFPQVIETDRLRLERLSRESVPVGELYEHCAAAAPAIDEVTRYLTWEPHETPQETREFLERVESAWEAGESAQYVVRPREGEPGAGELAGATGLTFDWDCRVAEPGIWLREPFWGRGYSGERAGGLFDLAFDTLDLDLVRIPVHPGNEKSLAAVGAYVDRFGGCREGTVQNFRHLAGRGPSDMVLFSVSRAEFRAATA